jgi:type I restriction enzyme M protein
VLAPIKAAVLAEHRDKEQAGRLYLVVEKFALVERHPKRVDNVHMGLVF